MNKEPQSPRHETEIDLLEILRGVWKQKVIVLLVFILVLAGTIFYLRTAPVIYEAKIRVMPPSLGDIVELNLGRAGATDLSPLTPQKVYGFFSAQLQSDSLRQEFYRDVFLPSLSEAERGLAQDVLYARLQASLVVQPVVGADHLFAVTASTTDRVRSADWVVAYTALAARKAGELLLKDTRSEIDVAVKGLELRIAGARKVAHERRDDKLVKLREALSIAEAIGLKQPSGMFKGAPDSGVGTMSGELTYFRGAHALKAEISGLEQRGSDDPFVQSLREMEASLDTYKDLLGREPKFEVYRQDGEVVVPDTPVKPRKLLIIVAGTFLACLAGFASGLLFYALRSARERRG